MLNMTKDKGTPPLRVATVAALRSLMKETVDIGAHARCCCRFLPLPETKEQL